MSLALDPQQVKVATEAYHEARNFGASPREMKALGEALWVESKSRNLHYGDRDSVGALQQRPSTGWLHAQNVKLAVRDFLTHARAKSGLSGSAGKLAQAVQVSAYPARYDAAAPVATELQRRFGGGSASSSNSLVAGHRSILPGQVHTVNQTIDDPVAKQRVALAQYLQKSDPGSLLLRLGVVDPLEPVTKTVQKRTVMGVPKGGIDLGTGPDGSMVNPHASPTHTKGVANFEGHKVAAWIKPALEYARQRGWKGTVESGYRSFADQTRIYNSGVRPAAKPGTSNHEFTAFPGGAIDATEAEHLAHILKTSPYSKLLVWAGSKDPVHFSHPHNGSY
jgi:hypothetical protein